jgi:hypothetical protein
VAPEISCVWMRYLISHRYLIIAILACQGGNCHSVGGNRQEMNSLFPADCDLPELTDQRLQRFPENCKKSVDNGYIPIIK